VANASLPVAGGGFDALTIPGSYQVAGNATTVVVNFAFVGITFSGNGLPSTTPWEILLYPAGDPAASTLVSLMGDRPVLVNLTNGTYDFAVAAPLDYAPTETNGSFQVGTQAATIDIDFVNVSAPAMYLLLVNESGLAAGTDWQLVLQGQSSMVMAPEGFVSAHPNGTYGFSVGAVPGFTPTPSFGFVTVDGRAADLTIDFTANRTLPPPTNYSVTFEEHGLLAGTSWSVSVDGVARSSSTASIVFELSNGTFGYVLGAVPAESPNVSSGSVRVAGASMTIDVTFSSASGTTHPTTNATTNLPASDWAVLGAVIGLLVGALLAWLGLRGRKPEASGPPPAPASATVPPKSTSKNAWSEDPPA
jgi:hypothetical protein